MKAKHIHFVCRGNRYRSRLAEAVFRSFELPDFKVSSSGTEAHRMKATIEPYTRQVAKEHGLLKQLSADKHQIDNKQLKEADIIIFLSKDVYDEACKEYEVDPRKSLVWHIADVDGQLQHLHATKQNKAVMDELTEKAFEKIYAECQRLAGSVSKFWVDVVDAHNKPTGLRLPVSWVTSRGLWHRGCHAVITTPDRKYVIEKRSSKIIFAPNHLEISMGGYVDSGETSRHAIIREIQEELGLKVRPEQLTLIDVHKWSSYHPHYHMYTRSFIYTYHVALTENDPMLRVQPSEVALATLLSRRKVNRLLRVHRLRHLGPLKPGYQYYNRIVKLAGPYMKAGAGHQNT